MTMSQNSSDDAMPANISETVGSSRSSNLSFLPENTDANVSTSHDDFAMDVKSIRFVVPPRSFTTKKSGEKLSDDDFSVVSSEHYAIQHSAGFSAAKNEEAVSINFTARRFTKLEIISAKGVTKLLWWFHGAVLFGTSFSILFVILANTVYLKVDTLGDIKARYYSLSSQWEWLLSVASVLCFLYATCLATVYTSRMVRLRRQDRTHEQVWVILLTIAAAMYLSPYENIARIMKGAGYNLREEPWYDHISRMYDSLRDASFTASTLFYVWATVHSYRILSGRLGWRFYLPKVMLVIFYMFLKQFAFWRFNIYMSEMPIASVVAMLYLYGALKSWPLPGVFCVIAVTVFELMLVTWIVYQISITRNFLKGKDYMKHRTKQIGLRFFLYHNLTFYSVFWLCYLILLLGLPPGAQLAAMKFFGVSYVEVQYVPFGLTVLYLSYVTVEAYVNLPADAIGLRGWLNPQAPDLDGILEPITYRKREVPAQELQTNCFVMETHVMLFNFAWLVYYYNTPKMSKLRNTRRNNFVYEVSEQVSNIETDTHALLVDGNDRIVVSFRGTNSWRNLRTDLKAFHVKMNRVLPTLFGDSEDICNGGSLGSVSHAILGSRDGQDAKIHRGFAAAYKSVAVRVIQGIKKMQAERPRPVFLTGHSLGGALATICAYDCVLKLDIGARDLYVATYGSPRVGNGAFRRLYDEAVPASWRVSIAADLVTKLPKVGYQHVGKKVMLTTAGDLFIDPNSLELSIWDGDATSLIYHRKASYLLAMRSWCSRNDNGSYRPSFWDWPSSADDRRRWPDAISDVARTNDMDEHRRNLLHQDAMIDALNLSKADNSHDGAIENWSRLSRRLLLNDAVHRIC